MSRVFLATENSLGRRVVVKVLNPELAEGLSSERFTREVRLAARLQHPNVVPVLSAGQLASLPYYTMPFIDGASLRERLTTGPLTLAEAVTVLRDVARALAYAHANGIVHRDIKPENVLLTGGAAVVADFGIAKAIAESAGAGGTTGTLTALGTAIGTPAYMAPEQAAGDPDTDHRADLYAWGLLAWESLTGRHPFSDRRTPMELIGAHMTRTPEAVTAIRAEVPPALSSLVAKCLAKDPADRPADALAVLGALDGVMLTPGEPIAIAVTPSSTPSIAVLPFANLSGNAEDEYFSDGMTEEVISALSRLRGLRVAARTSSFAFKGTHTDIRIIAEQLGVRTILEGSVRKAGSRVRIAVQLVSAVDGLNLWSERYDREIANIFALQDDIARAITGALEVHLALGADRGTVVATPRGSHGTVDPAAYDLLLRGRFLFFQYQAAQALACFERAAAIDPEFVLAHAWIGFASILGANIHLLPAESGYARGRAAGERVRALDPKLAEGMILGAAVALWFDWDREAGEALARRAVNAAPGLSLAYEFLGYSLIAAERFDEGIAAMEAAYALDPLSDFMLGHLVSVNSCAGREAHAIELAQRGIVRSPGSAHLHRLLGVALLGANRVQEAREALLRSNELAPEMAQMPSALGCALAATGDRGGAMRILASLEADAAAGKVALNEVACLHLWLGQEEKAFSWLERDVSGRANWGLSSWLHVDPRFKRLRGHPRFEAVLRRIGFVDGPATERPPSVVAGTGATPLRPRRMAWLVGGLVVLVAAGALALRTQGERAQTDANQRSIAVLPFENEGRDTASNYFADGMSDEVAGMLAKAPELRVASRRSVDIVRAKRVSDQKIGKVLDVAFLLGGTVRRAGERVRVTAQLTNTADGSVRWSRSYDGTTSDPFQLQDKIAGAIASELRTALGDQVLAAARAGRTPNAEAYDLFLRGRYAATTGSESALRQALGYFERAIAIDPQFARAQAGIGYAWTFLADAYVPASEAYPRARDAAQRALMIDSLLADAHAVHGYATATYYRDARGLAELKRATELAPNVSDWHLFYGQVLCWSPPFDCAAGVAEMRKAVALDPLSPLPQWGLAQTYYLAKRYDESIAAYRHLQEIDANFFYLDHYGAASRREKGDNAGALREYEAAQRKSATPLFGLATTHAKLGQASEARRIATALERSRATRHVPPDGIAMIYAALGDRDLALKWLEQADREHSPLLGGMEIAPEYARLREDPRFIAIARRVRRR